MDLEPVVWPAAPAPPTRMWWGDLPPWTPPVVAEEFHRDVAEAHALVANYPALPRTRREIQSAAACRDYVRLLAVLKPLREIERARLRRCEGS